MFLKYKLLALLLCVNVICWLEINNTTITTQFHTPPAPEPHIAALSSLGDTELAHRRNVLFLQNLGNDKGKSTHLSAYNYNNLKNWFFLQNHLNPYSDATPLLAAYYFGGIQDPDKLAYVLDYLEHVGQSAQGEKWRWLGHAVYLAKDQMGDLDRALSLAQKLSQNKSPDLADWARQMPAFIYQNQGRNDMALDIMMGILQSNADTLHPNEINYMIDYICNRLIDHSNAQAKPNFCL